MIPLHPVRIPLELPKRSREGFSKLTRIFNHMMEDLSVEDIRSLAIENHIILEENNGTKTSKPCSLEYYVDT